MAIIENVVRLFRGSQMANRRRFHRYDVKAPVTVRLGTEKVDTYITNVSASGAMLTPPVPFPPDSVVSLYHPVSDMTFDVEILRSDEEDSRVRFRNHGNGTILSLWARGLEPDDSDTAAE
ncbi:MAG: PilZ domain-containing protein [Alphaproteobacteria bacterium]|nr:PilZ domain-containing protein [Alphaproteobacteria bacterium]